VFYTYIKHEGKNYKLMIDGGNYANIIAKTVLEKMGLKAEPHPHPYNVNWVDKTDQFITQCWQVPIHMSSYRDRVRCDVLDINTAHVLLDRPWMYDLDVTSLGKSNTYKFKFNEKKIVLKLAKIKSNVRNNEERTVTTKDNKTPCYLVSRPPFFIESPIDRSTLRSKNSLGLFSLPLSISHIVTVELSAPHLHELHDLYEANDNQ